MYFIKSVIGIIIFIAIVIIANWFGYIKAISLKMSPKRAKYFISSIDIFLLVVFAISAFFDLNNDNNYVVLLPLAIVWFVITITIQKIFIKREKGNIKQIHIKKQFK